MTDTVSPLTYSVWYNLFEAQTFVVHYTAEYIYIYLLGMEDPFVSQNTYNICPKAQLLQNVLDQLI